MIFSSLQFFIFFLLTYLCLTLSRNQTYRKTILLLASYVFYAAWDWRFLGLIITSSAIDYFLGFLIFKENKKSKRLAFLICSLTLNLGMLGFFKYANFFIDSFVALFSLDKAGTLDIILPVGISFFTFQTMSYSIDIYRRSIEPSKNPLNFFLFVAFFPQLVAGPIVRASEFLPQLHRKIQLNKENFITGAKVFAFGFFQKSVLADTLSVFVDRVYENIELYSSFTVGLCALAYTGQIFCDFSGYTLMAIGVGKILGFNLPKNFNYPYLSKSVTEFWQRWHISLSTWLRDYLYIPLGGNRKGSTRTYINLMITMTLGGLWHGASWNFVVWGILHGLALAVHRLYKRKSQGLPSAFGWLISFVLIVLLWIPFRSPDFDVTIQFLKKIASLDHTLQWAPPQILTVLTFMIAWHIWVQFKPFRPKVRWLKIHPLTLDTITIMAVVFSIFLFAPAGVQPFIYFQF